MIQFDWVGLVVFLWLVSLLLNRLLPICDQLILLPLYHNNSHIKDILFTPIFVDVEYVIFQYIYMFSLYAKIRSKRTLKCAQFCRSGSYIRMYKLKPLEWAIDFLCLVSYLLQLIVFFYVYPPPPQASIIVHALIASSLRRICRITGTVFELWVNT